MGYRNALVVFRQKDLLMKFEPNGITFEGGGFEHLERRFHVTDFVGSLPILRVWNVLMLDEIVFKV